ncbi:MAG: T9SS type A sorting domain-containing protein, partial [Candidatus Marinimicrobia bacterium]|nr:T9SS type A sorting domain-containing protein [Candidatus Neomarinimicrobiota bacterium]
VDFRLYTLDKWVYDATELDEEAVAATFELGQNYPNPFNPTTTIPFVLDKNVNVTLTVYNMLGQEVATLMNHEMQAGYHTVNFDASTLATGMYIYKLQAGEVQQTRRMMLVK